MMVIENKFDIGQTVYIKTDKEQNMRIVNSIQVCFGGSLLYCSSCCGDDIWCADFELSDKPNVEITFNN